MVVGKGGERLPRKRSVKRRTPLSANKVWITGG
jgi:hypothetical protein